MAMINPGEDGEHKFFCRICEAFCGLKATVEDGKITRIKADKDNVSSRGYLCAKGPAMADVAYDPDRILYPMKRSGDVGEFERVSWSEAIADIADKVSRIKADYSAEAIGMYVGNPAGHNSFYESGSMAFINNLGSNQFYDTNSVDASAPILASEMIYYGYPTIPDLPNADYLLIIGANPLVSHGSLISAPRIRDDMDAIASRGKVIVIDPRKTKTASRYEHQAIKPNTDVYLLIGMLNTIFERKLTNQSFINAHTTGCELLQQALAPISLEQCASHCGIGAERIVELAEEFCKYERASVYGRLGICRAEFSTMTNFLLNCLNIVTGKFGRKGGAIMGFNPYLPADYTAHNQEASFGKAFTRTGNFPSLWGILPGTLLADEILSDEKDHLRALFVSAGNPVLSNPDGDKIEKALSQLDLQVSFDLYINETNQYADYILPATTLLERDDIPFLWGGLMPKPALHYSPAVIQPMGEAKRETEVLQMLSDALGLPNPIASGLLQEEMTDEHQSMDTEGAMDMVIRSGAVGDQFGNNPGGYTLADLKRKPEGILLIDVDATDEWKRYVRHEDQKLLLWNDLMTEEMTRLAQKASEEKEDGSLSLFGKRDTKSMNSWMHNVPHLVGKEAPALFMHPVDAEERHINTGDTVEVSSKVATLKCKVKITSDIVQGAVCYPHGWGHAGNTHATTAQATGGVNINQLISSEIGALEGLTGIPLMDGCPVQVRKYAV